MKVTNVILTIFIAATISQAQTTALPNGNDDIASVTEVPFSEIPDSEKTKKTVESENTPPADDFVFFCFPSMFSNELFVTTNSIELSEIQLLNEAGQVVFKVQTEGMVENERLELPTTLPAGTYFLQMKDKESTAIRLMKRN